MPPTHTYTLPLHTNAYAHIQMVAHKEKIVGCTHAQTNTHVRETHTHMHEYIDKHNGPEASFENLRFFPLSFSSVEPYGEWEKKKCSRGAGYLHIYSSGFISLPADSAA